MMAGRNVLLLLPSAAVMVSIFALPLMFLLVISFWSVKNFRLRPDFSLAAWERFATAYSSLTLYTLAVGIIVGVICTAIGLAFAYAARFKVGRFGDGLIIAVLITLFGGYLVKVYAWKIILGADGIINGALMSLGLIDAPLNWLIYSRSTVILALVNFLLPFAILPIYAAMRNIPDTTIEAARDLGASPTQAFVRVVLPLSSTGAFSAFAFCFLIGAGDYVTPMLLGGTSGSMLGQFVALEFSTRFNWPAGAAMSLGLLASCVLLLGAIALIMKQRLR
jgi:spermidine/putrescine transport system permease protein